MNHDIQNPSPIRLGGPRFATIPGVGSLARVLLNLRLRLQRWSEERRAIRHLESLEDHRLDDIGIDRPEIPAAVRGLPEGREIFSRSGIANRESDTHHRLAA